MHHRNHDGTESRAYVMSITRYMPLPVAIAEKAVRSAPEGLSAAATPLGQLASGQIAGVVLGVVGAFALGVMTASAYWRFLRNRTKGYIREYENKDHRGGIV